MSTPIIFQYSPNETVWAIDKNSFLITELVVVDGRWKVFSRNKNLIEQFRYTTKTPRLGIHSTQSDDVLYATLQEAIDALLFTDDTGGVMPPYSIDYLANPLETIYFVDKNTLAIYSGVVESVHIKTFMRGGTIIDTIEYRVRTTLGGILTYHTVKEGDIFLSYEEAYESLFGIMPTPSPTVTIGISPTPTPTSSMTRTPTPTPSGTIPPTVTPTPTIGVSSTPSPSVTPTPSPSATAEVTPAVSVTPSITITITPTPSSTPVYDSGMVPDLLLTSRPNGSGFTLTKGTPVSLNTNGELVRASSIPEDMGPGSSSAARYLGVVHDDFIPPGTIGRVLLEGSINNTDTNWSDLNVLGSPLQLGYKYYLSESPGKITSTPPTSGYIKQIGFAANSRTLDLRFGPLIKLRSL